MTKAFASPSPPGAAAAANASEANLTATADPTCVDYDALQVPLAVLYSLIFAVGLVGNALALWVFFCVSAKSNSVRVFLVNVAFADLLLVACLPFRILYHSRGNVWDLDPTLCRAVGNLFYMNMYISITLLGLISVDRYLKIRRGAGTARRRLRSTRRSRGLCALVWTVSFVLMAALLLSKGEPPSNRCFHYKRLRDDKWRAYVNVAILVLFWLVFLALAASYGRIARDLMRASREKPDLPNAARFARSARKSFFILFLFTVCFAPYHVVRIFYIGTQIYDTPCSWRAAADRANETALLLSALNSCLDPIMYFLLSSSVRKEVLRLAASVLRMREPPGVSASSSATEPDGGSGRNGRGRRAEDGAGPEREGLRGSADP